MLDKAKADLLTAGMERTVLCVAGARPNFVKIAPIMRALTGSTTLRPVLVHTGQHYDDKMSQVFFDQLQIRAPDVSMAVGSASHAAQTAEIMRKFEEVLDAHQPEVVLVVGDVNSTAACALVTAKYRLRQPFTCRLSSGSPPVLRHRPVVVHVEAGLRSGDDDMPEEVNRRVTDVLADVLFTTEAAANAHLAREGVASGRIHFVGNVMIDSLLAVRAQAEASPVVATLLASRGLVPGHVGLVTLHRPSNVDHPEQLRRLLDCLQTATGAMPLVFPAHPRTRQRLAEMGITLAAPKWHVVDPLGYVDFVGLMHAAALVCTDSGGVQEETTVLGTPCVTLRETTERPSTVTDGTNMLVGTVPAKIAEGIAQALRLGKTSARRPQLWDGQAAPRIVAVLESLFIPQ